MVNYEGAILKMFKAVDVILDIYHARYMYTEKIRILFRGIYCGTGSVCALREAIEVGWEAIQRVGIPYSHILGR
jgi:hypothetical protein